MEHRAGFVDQDRNRRQRPARSDAGQEPGLPLWGEPVLSARSVQGSGRVDPGGSGRSRKTAQSLGRAYDGELVLKWGEASPMQTRSPVFRLVVCVVQVVLLCLFMGVADHLMRASLRTVWRYTPLLINPAGAVVYLIVLFAVRRIFAAGHKSKRLHQSKGPVLIKDRALLGSCLSPRGNPCWDHLVLLEEVDELLLLLLF